MLFDDTYKTLAAPATGEYREKGSKAYKSYSN